MEDISETLWFPTPIWIINDIKIDQSELKNYVLSIKEKDKKGRNLTNYGGWQSQQFVDNNPLYGFRDILDRYVNHVACRLLGKEKISSEAFHMDYWFNINSFGDYNTLHHHRGSLLSGVYYIDLPSDSKKCGKIVFRRDDDMEYYVPEGTKPEIMGTSVQYDPIVARLILFPSWLKHEVQGNRTKGERISMSFNYQLLPLYM